MSSLPDIFRDVQGQFIRPVKQGGIFTLKYQSIQSDDYAKIQPQQFYSVKLMKNSESRIGTSHTIRSQKISSLANTRLIATSQSQRKSSSRKTWSRPQSRDIRKDIYNNYGNSRVSFAIGQTISPPIEQAQSLIHQLNENKKQMKKLQQSFDEITKIRLQTSLQIKRLNYQLQNQMNQIQQNTQNQFKRLRILLSSLRRNSGMDTKVNRTDINQVQQQLDIIAQVMNQIDTQSAAMQNVCLK